VATADHTPGDRLNDHLDDIVTGGTSSPHDLDSDTAEAVRHFFAQDDAPAPPRDLATQIWEDLMNQSALAGAIPFRPTTGAMPAPHGRSWPYPRRRESVPGAAWHRRGPWVVAQLATAALLLVTFGLGYLAFGPRHTPSDKPTPDHGAATALASPEPTSTPVPFSPTGPALTGAWRWQGDEKRVGVFVADGTYLEYSPGFGVGIGRWRPTGERTADLVIVYQRLAGFSADDEVFAADYVPSGHEFRPGETIQRLTVELDMTGKVLTATGTSERRNPDGTEAFPAGPITLIAARLGEAEVTEVMPTAAAGGVSTGTGTLVVQVVDADGATPVGGACLEIAGPVTVSVCDDGEGDVDPAPGSIEVDDLMAGMYRVAAQAPSGHGVADGVEVEVGPAEIAAITVVLTPADAPPAGTAFPPTVTPPATMSTPTMVNVEPTTPTPTAAV
jgi:hypothetical protein